MGKPKETDAFPAILVQRLKNAVEFEKGVVCDSRLVNEKNTYFCTFVFGD